MKKILLILIIYTSFGSSQNLNFYEGSHAIVIGINNYNSNNINNLNYAVEDADSVAKLLISKFNFPEENVHLITNKKATRDYIKNTLYSVAMKANANDRIIIFYAGHGETIKIKTGGEIGYLIPVDGDPQNLYVTGISMRDFKEISEITSAKHVLYLIDVCYGGLMALGTRSLKKIDFDEDEKYINKITKESARQIITAGGKNDKAQERAIWGHSAFTKELLHGMSEGLADSDQDGYITADELGTFLSKKVYITSEEGQTPQKGRYGSGEGELVFINPNYNKIKIDKNSDEKLVGTKINTNDYEEKNKQLTSLVTSSLTSSFEVIAKDVLDLNVKSVSNFQELEPYLDSTFIPSIPIDFETSSKEDTLLTKIIFPYYDFKSFRFSTIPFPTYFNHNRVSGLELGTKLIISQLKPIAMKLNYTPIYNFSKKQLYHHASLYRHIWGKKNHFFGINYNNKITSNDHWMRRNGKNVISSLFYGKDYMDHFHEEGFELHYRKHLNSFIAINMHYINSYQKNMSVIKNYKESILKKKSLPNRTNFYSSENDFKDGRHTKLISTFTFNKLKTDFQKTFKYNITTTDTNKNVLNNTPPELLLIAESQGWPNKTVKMELIRSDTTYNMNFSSVITDSSNLDLSHIKKNEMKLDSNQVAVNDSSNIKKQKLYNKNLENYYEITHYYESEILLPPGSHAYRYLIDSLKYEIDANENDAILENGTAVSTVTINIPFRFDIGYVYADRILGGDFSYEKLSFNISGIYTLSDHDYFLFRFIGGWSKNNYLPVQNLFYLGGEGSIRGYDYMDTKKHSGTQMFLSKFEYHIPTLSNIFNTYLFYDVGFIGKTLNFDRPLFSFGIGVSNNGIYDNLDDSYSIILYNTKESNQQRWGFEFIYSYFFDQLDINNINFPGIRNLSDK